MSNTTQQTYDVNKMDNLIGFNWIEFYYVQSTYVRFNSIVSNNFYQ